MVRSGFRSLSGLRAFVCGMVLIALAVTASGSASAESGSTPTATVVYSKATDRTSPTTLNGATVSGKIYVFLKTSGVLAQVRFYLDEAVLKNQAKAVTDTREPFDLAGSSAGGAALPLDTKKLKNGRHLLYAVTQTATGSKTTLKVAFTVKNAAAKTGDGSAVRPANVERLPTAPLKVCGVASLLTGPASPPAGAITVPAGDNSKMTPNWLDNGFSAPGKTFWFAPGVHTLGADQFSQIIPGSNSTFIGAPGAVLDGQKRNRYAFTATAKNVTIKYLTIRNFGTGKSNNDEGVVNHDRGDGWTISNNTMTLNDGAAVMLGPNSKTTYNCLKDNGQYGFSALAQQDATNVDGILLDHNEITGNNTDDWERLRDGCGCTGGGKFWEASNVVVTNNYVHDNRGVGLWADNNNRGFLFERNWIEGNDAEGIMYEISYNFLIRSNVLVKNGLVTGKKEFGGTGNTFPMPAIYISESGGDTRAGTKYAKSEITGNLFVDNWDGIALWENADRFCRPGEANDTTNTCPFFDKTWGTRFKTQNISITKNDFRFTAASTGCTNKLCGRNSVFSNWGTVPANSPYMKTVVQQAITFDQKNVWANNKYTGQWHFQPWDMGTDKTFAQWQASPYGQDKGSTYKG